MQKFRIEEYTKPNGVKEYSPQVWARAPFYFFNGEWRYIVDGRGRRVVCETLEEANNFLKWYQAPRVKYHEVNL